MARGERALVDDTERQQDIEEEEPGSEDETESQDELDEDAEEQGSAEESDDEEEEADEEESDDEELDPQRLYKTVKNQRRVEKDLKSRIKELEGQAQELDKIKKAQ